MKVKIGKLLPDGHVRHIGVIYKTEVRDISFRLKNFYSREKRLDALLNLGNLYRLGSSPYGKYRHGTDDTVNCFAAIRDYSENKKKNEAGNSFNRDIFAETAEICFLYENGKWSILRGKRNDSIDSPEIEGNEIYLPLNGLEIYRGSSLNKLERFMKVFHTWDEIKAFADENNETLHVFRGNRLVKTIFHRQLKKENE